jgi:type II secretory pathway pseudopilin PulG
MQHAPQSRARIASAAAREDGFGLIEVLVTAVLVIIVGTAVFGALDASSRASGRGKARSVASTLAQRDQERMRALDVETLNNLRKTSTEKACDENDEACLTYTIESRTQWVSDETGTASCTSSDARADYLQLISTVTWPDMQGMKPVVMKSIYSPPVGSFGPTEGSLAVKLVGADGVTPVRGVQVRLSGPKSFSDRTNAAGCVVWGYLPAGSGYTISLNEPGYVDPQGVQAVDAPASVIGESLTTSTFLYDRASTARVTFFSRIGTTDYPDQKAERITLGHTQMAPTTRTFPIETPTSAQDAISTLPLFPFSTPSPYRIFAGGCDAQDPAKQSPADTALLTLPDLDPGEAVGYALQLPAIDTRITVNNGSPTDDNAPAYKVIQTTPSCSSSVTPELTPVPTSGPDAGRLMQMGRPYGTYTVCAQATIGTQVYREAYENVVISKLDGIRVPSIGTPGVIDIEPINDEPLDCNAPIP